MPPIIIDCHLHTTRYSRCSRLAPERACELALARGLDGVVITEHRRRWSDAELEPLRRAYPRLLLFSGMEVTLAEGYDVVVIGPGVPQMAAYHTPLEDVAGWLERGDVFAFLAHAFRFTRVMDAEMRQALEVVHGMEVNSVNILRAGSREVDGSLQPDNALQYLDAAMSRRLVPLSNSDAHAEAAVGTLATRLDAPRPVRTLDELVAALFAGRTSEFQNPDQLRACL